MLSCRDSHSYYLERIRRRRTSDSAPARIVILQRIVTLRAKAAHLHDCSVDSDLLEQVTLAERDLDETAMWMIRTGISASSDDIIDLLLQTVSWRLAAVEKFIDVDRNNQTD